MIPKSPFDKEVLLIKDCYDVLRLIEQNQRSYISSDCIRGCLLPQWIHKNSEIDKFLLFQWIQELVEQLGQVHKCVEKPYYQYVNPYCIVISDNLELYLLDTDAKDNAPVLKIMKKREIREYFLPDQMSYYQKPSQKSDIYGLGKTIQYMLAVMNISPKLSILETKKYQKVISRCLNWNSKKSYQDLSEIQKIIPVCNEKKKTVKRKIVMIGLVSIIAVSAGVFVLIIQKKPLSAYVENEEYIEESLKNKETNIKEEFVHTEKEDELYLELGLIEWIDLKDYQKSSEYLKKASNYNVAQSLYEIASCFTKEYVDENNLRVNIKLIEIEMEQIDSRYEQMIILCLLEAYDYLNENNGTLEDARETIVFCDNYMSKMLVENQTKLIRSMAFAYEKMEEKEKAITMYEQLLRIDEDVEEKEEVYLKISQLFIELDKIAEAKETLKEGLKECKESTEIGISYIRILLSDSDIDRKVCIENLNLFLDEYTYLKEEETVSQLLEEKGMQMKGERVCEKEQ